MTFNAVEYQDNPTNNITVIELLHMKVIMVKDK